MTGLREEKKRQTREAILQNALRLFAEKGVENTSIEEIAQAAGVGKSTIYGYFETKGEIFAAYCDDKLSRILTDVEPLLASDAPTQDKLFGLFWRQMQNHLDGEDHHRHMIREMAFPALSVAKEVGHSDEKDPYVKVILRIMADGQQRGCLRPDLDPLITTGHLYGLFQVTVTAWYNRFFQSPDEVREGLRALIRQAFEGLATGTQPGRAS